MEQEHSKFVENRQKIQKSRIKNRLISNWNYRDIFEQNYLPDKHIEINEEYAVKWNADKIIAEMF